MRHRNDLSVEQSKREEPLFAVGFARVLGSNCVAGKYFLRVCEVNAMIAQVFLALVLVPGEHRSIVATLCSYGKTCPAGLNVVVKGGPAPWFRLARPLRPVLST